MTKIWCDFSLIGEFGELRKFANLLFANKLFLYIKNY